MGAAELATTERVVLASTDATQLPHSPRYGIRTRYVDEFVYRSRWCGHAKRTSPRPPLIPIDNRSHQTQTDPNKQTYHQQRNHLRLLVHHRNHITRYST